MNKITVTVAKAEEFETVGVLVHKLLTELFPDEDEFRNQEKYVSAGMTLSVA